MYYIPVVDVSRNLLIYIFFVLQSIPVNRSASLFISCFIQIICQYKLYTNNSYTIVYVVSADKQQYGVVYQQFNLFLNYIAVLRHVINMYNILSIH